MRPWFVFAPMMACGGIVGDDTLKDASSDTTSQVDVEAGSDVAQGSNPP